MKKLIAATVVGLFAVSAFAAGHTAAPGSAKASAMASSSASASASASASGSASAKAAAPAAKKEEAKTMSKEQAIQSLYEAGIFTKEGKFAEPYEGIEKLLKPASK